MRDLPKAVVVAILIFGSAACIGLWLAADLDRSKAERAAHYEALIQDCMSYQYPRFRCEAVLYRLR
jgi:hypothetical protein